jgi:predicted Zn-dependent protease
MATALRDLPAGTAVQIAFLRPGTANSPPQPTSYLLSAPADYTAPPRYAASFAVILKRSPGLLPFSYAAAKDLVEEGKADAAMAMLKTWPAAWRGSAPGQLVLGDILVAQGQTKAALGAYTRAAKADPSLSTPQVQRGLALATLGNIAAAGQAFAAAVKADPFDAVTLGYRAYLLAATGAAAQALDLANRAIARQPNYEYGHLARGLALIALGRKKDGVEALKRGLVLTADHPRAAQIITQYLEPNDP